MTAVFLSGVAGLMTGGRSFTGRGDFIVTPHVCGARPSAGDEEIPHFAGMSDDEMDTELGSLGIDPYPRGFGQSGITHSYSS